MIATRNLVALFVIVPPLVGALLTSGPISIGRTGSTGTFAGTVTAAKFNATSTANDSITTAGGITLPGPNTITASGSTITLATNTTVQGALASVGNIDVRSALLNSTNVSTCSGSAAAVCVDDAGGLAVANGSGTTNATISAAGAISGASAATTTFLAITAAAALPTCENILVGRLYLQQGGGSTIRSRICLCTSDGNAPTAVFAWQDLATGVVDDDVSCDG